MVGKFSPKKFSSFSTRVVSTVFPRRKITRERKALHKKLWEIGEGKRCCVSAKWCWRWNDCSRNRMENWMNFDGENKFSFGCFICDSYHEKLLKIDTNWAFMCAFVSHTLFMLYGQPQKGERCGWINEKGFNLLSFNWVINLHYLRSTFLWCKIFAVKHLRENSAAIKEKCWINKHKSGAFLGQSDEKTKGSFKVTKAL